MAPDDNGGLRERLQDSVAASAAPYGYTLTIFSTGSLASHFIGTPHLPEVLLFVAGAVLAFLSIELIAFGHLRVRLVRSPLPQQAWGHAHLLSAGLAIFVSWVALQALDDELGWLAVGFLSTAVYLIVNAVQALLASRVAE